MIFYIIAILIMAYAFVNFQKAFLLFLLFKTILVTNITFLAVPGLPLLTVDTFMTLFFLCLFWVKRRKYLNTSSDKFPFKLPFVALFISWGISTIFAIAGFKTAFSQFVGNLSQLLLVWLIWILVKEEKDIRFLIKGFTCLFAFYALYLLWEYSSQSNPLVEYESTLISDERVIDWEYSDLDARGYRARSVFEHPIGAGVNFAMVGSFLLTLFIAFKQKYIKTAYIILVSILCSLCVFLCGSRGPIVFLLISYFSFVDLKSIKLWGIILVAIVGIIIVSPYLPSAVTDIFMSIFDSSYQAKVGGSDSDMRFNQLTAALAVMNESPIVGLGYKFEQVMNTAVVSELLGMESMWFGILTRFGLLGVMANIVSAYYFIVKIPKVYHSKQILFLSLAYWIVASMTSVPGMLIYLYYTIIIIYIKQCNVTELAECCTYMRKTRFTQENN